MPSYRSILTIRDLRAGQQPDAVQQAARQAVTQTTTLEAFQVEVVRGEPRVTIRFTAVDDADARSVHERSLTAVREVASAPHAVLAKVVGGRSVSLH
ncbi:FMN-dependent dehydrogenase [Actinomyces trachealis]|uniref:FMN-dependent dehydrogenase n=1 Tax=Actinomyces trachealis TaxID=2763540 RepID=UPI00189288BF|nr:FMN-dependent dehydrogenase [Actinomyces trachealis]